jgi:DNA-binding NarL/FixJ family response regulator
MRCLLVSSRSLFSPLLGGLLAQVCGVEMAVCGPDAAEAIRLIEACRPLLLLLELTGDEPCPWGQDVLERLLQIRPEARLICLQAEHCSCPDLDRLSQAARRALVAAPEGGWDWPQLVERIAKLAAQAGRKGPSRAVLAPQRLQGLAPRERTVLHRLGDGLTSRQIAAELGITLQTVETYRKNLANKLGVSGSQLVRLAVLCRCTDPWALLRTQ